MHFRLQLLDGYFIILLKFAKLSFVLCKCFVKKKYSCYFVCELNLCFHLCCQFTEYAVYFYNHAGSPTRSN